MALESFDLNLSSVHTFGWPHRTLQNAHFGPDVTYGLQTALRPQYHGIDLLDTNTNTIYLFRDLCTTNGSTWSCFAHCNDSSLIFSSLFTMHNCMVGAWMQNFTAEYAENNNREAARRNTSQSKYPGENTDSYVNYINITAANVSVRLNSPIEDDGALNLPRPLDLKNSSMLNQIGQNLAECFLKGCQDNPGCTSTLSSSPDLFLQRLNDLIENGLCPNIPSRIDSDIGGIGVSCRQRLATMERSLLGQVYVSYWIQISLALIGLLGVLLFNFVLPNPIFLNSIGMQLGPCRRMAHQQLSRLIISLTDFTRVSVSSCSRPTSQQ